VIAGETREVMRRSKIDPHRVYAMGMSSGSLMTSILGATYPDLFAAIGIMAGGPYRTYACFADRGFDRPQVETPLLASQAYDAMGPYARVVPILELHGDADTTVPPKCGEQTIDQWLRTDNLVASGGATQDAPLALTPASTATVTQPGRRPAQVREYRDPLGCLVGEKWTIAGMAHYWSGGTTEPAFAEFTDPTGPSAAEISWRFFSHFRRDEPEGRRGACR
jgi:poly(3-hydroxybutyrate) depolymerase